MGLINSIKGIFRQKTVTVASVWGDVGWSEVFGESMATGLGAFYEKNSLIYGCIEELATSASEPNLIVEELIKGEWQPIPDSALQELLIWPNPSMTSFDMVYMTVLYESLYGQMFFEKVRSSGGRVVQLVPITPTRMKPKVSQDGRQLLAWECMMPTGDPILFEPKDIIQFKRLNPSKPLEGLSPLSVCLRMAKIDDVQVDYVTAFFANAAVPFGLLQSKLRLEDVEVARIRERIKEQYQGLKGWHDVMILDADMEYQKMGSGLDQIDIENIAALPETRICMAFGVPPILVGALVGLQHATYANYAEARKSFWQETLMPLYRRHGDTFTKDLAREFGGDLRIQFDLSKVPALMEDENAQHLRVRENLKAGYVTVNEARQAVGLDVIPGQDIFLRPLNMMEVGATQKGLAKVISVSSPLQLKQADEDPNLRWHKALDATARAWEGPFKKEAERLFNEESDGLLAILRKEGKAAKMGLAFQLFLLAAVDFLTASTGEWRKGFYPLFDALLTAQGENIAARFGISFDLESPEVKSFLEGYTMRFSERMFAVDEKAINSLVQIAQGEGWSVPQLRDAIADEWGGFAEKRAEMIARTETIRSSNAGAKEAMREAGFKQIKWLTHIDDRTCDWCIDMDGKTIDIEDNFFDQGEQYTVTGKDGKEHSIVLDYDDVGYPPLHTDCRCTVVTVRED